MTKKFCQDLSYHALDMNIRRQDPLYCGEFITRDEVLELGLHEDRTVNERVLSRLEDIARKAGSSFLNTLDDTKLVIRYIGENQ